MKTIRICQNRTCRKQGAAKVLAAFQTNPVPDITIAASGCLGQCGNGPMVLVLPDIVWYRRVQPEEASLILKQHLHNGKE